MTQNMNICPENHPYTTLQWHTYHHSTERHYPGTTNHQSQDLLDRTYNFQQFNVLATGWRNGGGRDACCARKLHSQAQNFAFISHIHFASSNEFDPKARTHPPQHSMTSSAVLGGARRQKNVKQTHSSPTHSAEARSTGSDKDQN